MQSQWTLSRAYGIANLTVIHRLSDLESDSWPSPDRLPETMLWGLDVGRDWADKDFYRVLDVEPTSPPEAITKSYRTCMKIVHPDLNTQDPEIQATANKLAQAYAEAYEVLSNPARRSEYDRWRMQSGQRTQNQPPPAESRDPGRAERQAQEQEQARAQERERAEEQERAAQQAREEARARASEEKARRAAEEQARARERERAHEQARREALAQERQHAEERARARTAEQPASPGAGRTRQEAEARAWAFAMLQSDPEARAKAKARVGEPTAPVDVAITPKMARDGGIQSWNTPCEACEGSGDLDAKPSSLCPWCGGSGSQRVELEVPVGAAHGSVHESIQVAIGGARATARVRFIMDPPPPPTRWLPDPATKQPSRGTRLIVAALGLFCALALVAWGWNMTGTHAEAPQTQGDPSRAPSQSATPSQSAVLTYSRYGNDRFGFAVDVPIDWVADPESGSGDGVVHRSPDGLGELTVFGANNLDDDSVEAASEASQQAIIRDGGRITYAAAATAGDYFTISGYDADGDIFYTREWVGPGSSNTLTWTYPTDQKQKYDDLVNHVVESFTQGDLEFAH